jgi:tether containing UBX domain for GLUT4
VPQTTIRIRFTDMTQIEKAFPSTDTISSVYAFVHSTLREDVQPTKFVLCKIPELSFLSQRLGRLLDQSPPRRDFDVSDPKVVFLSLADLQLAPSSVLLVRFENESLNGGCGSQIFLLRILESCFAASNIPAPLAPSVLSQAVDF